MISCRTVSLAVILLFISGISFAQYTFPPAVFPEGISAPRTVSDYDAMVPQQGYMLPWAPLPEANILWKKRVWREIDMLDKDNSAFGYGTASSFTDMMINGALSGAFKTYSASDDRFTKELSVDEFRAAITPGSKNPIVDFSVNQVYKIAVKEDWIFLKKEGKFIVRILGIAPVVQMAMPDGTTVDKTVFWIYYPYMRDYLAKQNAGKSGTAQSENWDQYFEGRKFKSKLVKVSGYPEPQMPPLK